MKKNLKKKSVRPPTTESIDVLLAKYAGIYDSIAEREAALLPYREEIIEIADVFGAFPKNAERSRLLTGEIYEALVTRGISMKVDEDKVADLVRLLQRHAAGNLFKELFTPVISHRINPKAELFLSTLKQDRFARELRAAYMACVEMKEQKPRVRVSEIEVKAEEKEATA